MKSPKRILALIAVIAWIALIATTLVFAFLQTENSANIFTGLIYADIALPVVIFAIQLIARVLKKRRDDNNEE